MEEQIDNSAVAGETYGSQADQTPQSTDTTPQSEQSSADGQAEGLLAGKFKTQDDLVKGYEELQSDYSRKLGNYKETEAKATEYDALAEYLNMIGQPAQNAGGNVLTAPEEADTEQQYISREEFARQQQSMYENMQRQLRTRDQVSEAERLYPELKTDKTFRDFVTGQLVLYPAKTVSQIANIVKESFKEVQAQGAKEEIEKVSEKQQAFIEGSRKAPAPSQIDELREKAKKTGDWTAYLKEGILK